MGVDCIFLDLGNRGGGYKLQNWTLIVDSIKWLCFNVLEGMRHRSGASLGFPNVYIFSAWLGVSVDDTLRMVLGVF